MQHVAKKIKCPLCGAKNAADARRCTTCTRPLDHDTLPSQAVYQEALWAERIASKTRRTRTNPYLVLAVLALLGFAANYLWLGYGPDWIHAEMPAEKGSTWVEIQTNPDYRVDMPGTPMAATATTPAGQTVQSTSVWLDSEWDTLRDADTRSTGALLQSRNNLFAMIATGTAPDPGGADLRGALTDAVAALAPGAVLSPGEIQQLQNPPYGEQYDLRFPYTDWPDAAGAGVVRARAILLNGKVFLAATYFEVAEEPALQQHLLKNFVPAGAPERLAEAEATPDAP